MSKLKIKDNKSLKISRRRIEETIKEGKIFEDDEGVITVIGNLDSKHSLNVVYRFEKRNILIITFFAARKGRYERKILH